MEVKIRLVAALSGPIVDLVLVAMTTMGSLASTRSSRGWWLDVSMMSDGWPLAMVTGLWTARWRVQHVDNWAGLDGFF